MWLKELFEKDNVDFPEWLPNEYLKDEWKDAVYFKGENIHKWELTNPFGMNIITLTNNVYLFQGYDEDNQLIFEQGFTPEEEYTS